MPIPACCYCGAQLPTTRRRRVATPDQVANAAQYRAGAGKSPRETAIHICESCNRRPPTSETAAQVRNRVHQRVTLTQVATRSQEASEREYGWCTLFLIIDCGLFRWTANLNLSQAPPIRPPLADLTNIAPLQFSSPIKRTKSEPLPAAARIPPFSPQSPLSVLGRAAIVTLAADSQPTKVVALKLNTSEKTVRRWKRKFEEKQSLDDEPRSGRPMEFDEETCVNIASSIRRRCICGDALVDTAWVTYFYSRRIWTHR